LVRLNFVDANLTFLVLLNHALQFLKPSTPSLLLTLPNDLLNFVVSLVLLSFDLNDEFVYLVVILRICDVIRKFVNWLHNQYSDQEHAEKHEIARQTQAEHDGRPHEHV
jgi:hypothetical protein